MVRYHFLGVGLPLSAYLLINQDNALLRECRRMLTSS